jgi:tetratricopeptide (TPR) repeat protein
VLVLGTYREVELDRAHPLSAALEEWNRERIATRLQLGRFERAASDELLATLLGQNGVTPEFGEAMHRETEGNPFFLISILHSLNAGETRLQEQEAGPAAGWLPDALRSAVRVRLAHVPRELRPALEAAAVLGRRFDFDTLLALMRGPEQPLLEAVEALVRRRLLREEAEDGVYDFNHDKVREVVYRDIGSARRRLLHQAVAETLESHVDGATHERYLQLAEHFERAQVWSKALHYLVLAGERAQALFAMRDALHWMDRAVALVQAHPEASDDAGRLSILERRGAARAQAGQTAGAVADFQHVLDAARAAGDRTKARETLVQLGMAHRRADAYDAATACLNEALTQSRAMGDERHAADTLYHLGTVAWSSGLNRQAIPFHQGAVEICERAGFSDLVAVQAYHGRGESHYANAEPAAAIRCFTRSLELARRLGDRGYESENLMMIGHSCVGTKGLGDYPRAQANLQAALAIAQEADLQWHLGPTLLGLDHVRACTGRYGEAWDGFQKTLAWLESLRQTRYQLIAHDYIGHLLLDLGLDEMAERSLQKALAIGQDTGIMFWRATLEAHLAVARSRLGRPAAMLPVDLQAARERARGASERYMLVRCLDALAEIALAAGDADRCRTYADELLAIAGPNGLDEIEAAARRWRGEALLSERAFEAARAELALAQSLADRIGRVRLQIDVQAALARASTALGEHPDAQRHQGRVRDLSRAIEASLGSSGLQARLRTLAAAG